MNKLSIGCCAVLLCLLGMYVFHHTSTTAYIGSGSMEPTLKIGNAVSLAPVDLNENLTNEIVVYRVPKGNMYENYTEFLMHRVIADNGTHITTKGDNNAYIDEPVLKSCVTERVTAISDAFTNFMGYMAICSVPTVFFAVIVSNEVDKK